jgi:REase_DpnII-MboI
VDASYAGGAARMDFVLPEVMTVLEMKMARKGLGAKEIGEQLIIDITKYREYSKCKCLTCLCTTRADL